MIHTYIIINYDITLNCDQKKQTKNVERRSRREEEKPTEGIEV